MSAFDSFSGLAAFATTVQMRGFAAAGRKLGMSSSAVGKAVGRLESRLGVRLLQRSTRSIALTPEGHLLYERSIRILDSIREAENAITNSQGTVKGRLKVSVPTVIGRRIILPALPDFMRKYPDVDLDLVLDDRRVDIVEEGYDMALRMGALEDSRLIARRIGGHKFVTCASPNYLAIHGVPKRPEELASHQWVRFRFPSTGLIERWEFKNCDAPKALKQGLVLNDSEAVGVAARAGLGIAQVPAYMVIEDLAKERLLAVLETYSVNRGDVSLIWPVERTEVPRVRIFAEFLTVALTACVAR